MPAAKPALQAGDAIISIDAKFAFNKTQNELANMLRSAGVRIMMQVARQSEIRAALWVPDGGKSNNFTVSRMEQHERDAAAAAQAASGDPEDRRGSGSGSGSAKHTSKLPKTKATGIPRPGSAGSSSSSSSSSSKARRPAKSAPSTPSNERKAAAGVAAAAANRWDAFDNGSNTNDGGGGEDSSGLDDRGSAASDYGAYDGGDDMGRRRSGSTRSTGSSSTRGNTSVQKTKSVPSLFDPVGTPGMSSSLTGYDDWRVATASDDNSPPKRSGGVAGAASEPSIQRAAFDTGSSTSPIVGFDQAGRSSPTNFGEVSSANLGSAPKGFAVIPVRASPRKKGGGSNLGRSASLHELSRAMSTPTNTYGFVESCVDITAANNPNELPFRKLDNMDYTIDFKTRVNEGTKQLAPMVHEPYVDPAQMRKQTSWHEQLKGSSPSKSNTSASLSPSHKSRSNTSSPSTPRRALNGGAGAGSASAGGTPQQRVPISRRPRARSFGDPTNTRSRSRSAGATNLPQPKSLIKPPSVSASRHGGSGKVTVSGGRKGGGGGSSTADGGGGPTEAEIAAIRDIMASTIPRHTNAGAAAAGGIAGGRGGGSNHIYAPGANVKSFTAADDLASSPTASAKPTLMSKLAASSPASASKGHLTHQKTDLYSDGEGDSVMIDWGQSGSSKGKSKSKGKGKGKGKGNGGSNGAKVAGFGSQGAANKGKSAGSASKYFRKESGSAAAAADAQPRVSAQSASASSPVGSRPRSSTMDFKDLISRLELLMKKGQKVLATYESLQEERKAMANCAAEQTAPGTPNLVAEAEATMAAGVFPEHKLCRGVFGKMGGVVDLGTLGSSGPQVGVFVCPTFPRHLLSCALFYSLSVPFVIRVFFFFFFFFFLLTNILARV